MMFAYFFCQNMGWPGSMGPIGIAVLIGSVLGLWLWSKAAAAMAARRAEQLLAQEQEQRYAARVEWLAQWPAPVREPIARMAWASPELWAPMGLGREPRWVGSGANAAWDPGEGLVLMDVEATDIGVRVRLEMLEGQAPKHFREARDKMTNSFDIAAVHVVADHGNQIWLDLQIVDPLKGIKVSPLLDSVTAERIKQAAAAATTPAEETQLLTEACRGAQLMVPVNGLSCTDDIVLMTSQYGNQVTVNLASGAHGAVQGASRSGKSIFLNSLLAYASLMRDVRVVIIDPNSAAVAPWWRTAYLVCNSTNPKAATKVLKQVNDEMKARESLFWEARTDRITRFSPDMPLYLVVIDEIPEFASDKEFQAEAKRFGAQSAKFGGRFYPAGQKLDENSLSTATRANLFDRFCFRVESRHDMTHLFENAPDLMAKGLTAVDESMPQGTAIVRTRSHPQTSRARAVYMPTEACWVVSDAIVAVRGEVRPLPSKPTPATNSNAKAITATGDPAVIEAPPQKADPRAVPALPPRSSQGRNGIVVPFGRNRTEQGSVEDALAGPGDPEDQGTGTK
ncbi:FtsK/SpoIIIE domain-containing protein [Nocardia sp. NPDC049737]|uniref:FtsK/SpoIIIE domain-containing protein n=1 Tax=Nocardia sp. NPDC049737 TaxID=3154358 RepID=UPI003443F9A6